jgi:hypothetical protein
MSIGIHQPRLVRAVLHRELLSERVRDEPHLLGARVLPDRPIARVRHLEEGDRVDTIPHVERAPLPLAIGREPTILREVLRPLRALLGAGDDRELEERRPLGEAIAVLRGRVRGQPYAQHRKDDRDEIR